MTLLIMIFISKNLGKQEKQFTRKMEMKFWRDKMLVEKAIYNSDKKSRYICDMCRKELEKQDRILIGTSEKGKDRMIKRWDLCENCIKILDRNVSKWYTRIRTT